MSDDTTEAVVQAFADEARKHRDALDSGGVARLLIEAKVSRDGEVTTRTGKLRTRKLQSGDE